METKNKKVAFDYVNKGKEFTIFYEIERFIGEVLEQKEYQQCLDEVDLQDNLTVLDLGCNIGTFSLYIYDRAKKIYAVDLSPRCIELLTQTVKENNFNKILPICQTVYGHNGIVGVTSLDSTDGGNAVSGNDFKVNAITLAQLFKDNNIESVDLIKIDVESAEESIFNAPDFLEIKDKIHVIIGECHRRVYPEVLEKNGFECKLIKGSHFIAINKTYVDHRASD